MAWDERPYAGFSAAEPWLPLHGSWRTHNVACEDQNPASMLALYRRLLALRRRHRALSIGAIEVLACEGDVLRYERRHGDEHLLVALNLGSEPQPFSVPAKSEIVDVLASTRALRTLDGTLAADEGMVLRLGAA